MFFRFFFIIVVFTFSNFWWGGNQPISEPPITPPYLTISTPWADSLMDVFSLDEKIGQLFMVAANSRNSKEKDYLKVDQLIQNYHIGGLIYFQSTPQKHVSLVNRYQKISRIPLMNGIDGEWGLAMRIDSLRPYPWNMTLGAMRNDSLIYKMGQALGQECKSLGIHINFAPVVDVNSNPLNPIINARSYGESVLNVSKKGCALMNGIQDAGVLACAKHFPGHGDTKYDSHKILPVIYHDRSRIDTIDLPPFKKLIDSGISSVMVAHLNIPSLDSTEHRASSLSSYIVDSLLKNDLNFKGLIFTDALNMKGVSSYFKPGILEVEALRAGNDILLFSEDIPAAIKYIKHAIKDSILSIERINKSCHKILKAKEWLGLNNFTEIDTSNLLENTQNKKNQLLRDQINAHALTLIKNEFGFLPIVSLKDKEIRLLTLGEDSSKTFFDQLKRYASIDVFDPQKDTLEHLNHLIISIHKSNISPWKSYNISDQDKEKIRLLSKKTNVTIVLFANPYSLLDEDYLEDVKSVLIAYQNSSSMQSIVAQAIFGAIKIQGKLPITISEKFIHGTGIITGSIERLRYGLPESIGLDPDTLSFIDSIVNEAIENKATPGCQVLVAKSGTVVYSKSFGFHTYDKIIPVTDFDVYDLASITKISSTLPIIMQKVDEGSFDLDQPLINYLDINDTCSKAQLTSREILTHQAQLLPWIPFYRETLNEDGKIDELVYSSHKNQFFTEHVAENIFMKKTYLDSLFDRVIHSKMREHKEYKYSDLGYYILKEIIENQEDNSLKVLTEERIYSHLGANYITYHPLEKFNARNIVPTELDNYFRHQLLRGYVHDPGAAMQNGVGGHAGLFSNANDLAKLMQMYLNGGSYGGLRFIQKNTINEFTSCQYNFIKNRRGVGFDKPLIGQQGGPTCDQASPLSFGHSGFTGTITWADPKHDLIYVFLSNRIHPSSDNNLLVKDNIRTRIQEVIYNAIK